MKLIARMFLPAAILFAGALITNSVTYGKQEYVKKEKKGCNFCHVKAAKGNADDLNDAGKYYKEKKTLEGYKPKEGKDK